MSTRTLLRPVLRATRDTPARGSRTFLSRSPKPALRASENLNIRQLADSRASYDRDRTAFLAAGAMAGIVGIVYTSYKLKEAIDKQNKSDSGKVKMDSDVPKETFMVEGGAKRKVVLHDEDGTEIVPTGNSAVPTFPRVIDLAATVPSSGEVRDSTGTILPATSRDGLGTEYTLVGLGLRTVTFLSIQVYVVGFYVATSDIANLQSFLVKKVNSLATTLVPGEKEELRKALLDPVEGEATWNAILSEAGCRTAFRIVPVRDTDFPHLRDGLIRAITARSSNNPAYNDEGFGTAIRDFKGMLNRGKVPRNNELLLCRDRGGKLSVMYDDKGKKEGRVEIGNVEDERVSRLLWLNYLAGSKVASEPARTSITDGVMEFVERPVGTVAAQVL